MNKELAQKLLGMIQGAGDFLQGQIPDVLHQVLVWGIISSLAGVALGLLFLGGGIPAFYASFHANNEDKRVGWALVGAFFSIAGTLIACFNIYSALMTYFAPKLYLLEYLRHIVN